MGGSGSGSGREFVLALDQGTTSSRAIVFDASGEARGAAQREFRQIYPKPGWVEHDPMEIWESQLGVAREAMASAGVSARDLAGLGIANQRETTIVWERATGVPIYNAIVWQDRRTSEYCDELKRAGRGALIRERTGLVIDAYFSGSKVAWLLDHVPGARRRAERGELAFGTVESWLVWNLTGGRTHATDVTNASRTLFLDIGSARWDGELTELFGAPRELLPEVVSSSGVLGECSAPGLEGVAIAGLAGDQQAALFGQMCVEPGMVKCTYGTGCFILMNIGTEASVSRRDLITTIAWRLGDGALEYAREGSVFIGGAVTQWLRDGLGLIRSSEEVEGLARTVEDNGGVYLVPAFVGLGAPHWDQYARGIVAGITRGTTAGHLARAALEGIAFQVMDVLEVMRSDSGVDWRELRVDGGAARNDLLMQFQADILETPVARPRVTETTALGAAYLAGLATGVWRDREELSGLWRMERRFEPGMGHAAVERTRRRWRGAVERAKSWEPERGDEV